MTLEKYEAFVKTLIESLGGEGERKSNGDANARLITYDNTSICFPNPIYLDDKQRAIIVKRVIEKYNFNIDLIA